MRITEDILYRLVAESIQRALNEAINAVDIDAAWLEKKYNEFNQAYFGGILNPCYFGMFTTGRGSRGYALGHFFMNSKSLKYNRDSRRMYVLSSDGTKTIIDEENFFELCRPTIELNANYKWTEEAAEATLIHEMCHYYTYMYGFVPRQGHGSVFRDIAYKVSARSKGKFSIQRLATAEEMAQVELDPEIKAKNDQRKQRALDNAVVALIYTESGDVRLVFAANVGVINNIIKGHYTNRIMKVVATSDDSLKHLLIANGYRNISRTYRFWTIQDKPIYQKIRGGIHDGDFEFATVYKYQPQEHAVENTETNRKDKGDIIPHFRFMKGNGDIMEYYNIGKNELFRIMKQTYPTASDESLWRVINDKYYSLSESISELELYHGSPKQDSFDKFDIAYLSSGLGQQSYGYGFYLTNSMDAAKQYGGGGYMYKVEVPNGKYLSYKSISEREKQYIAKTFFKYYTTEDEYGKQAYSDEETRKYFWDEECRYILDCEDGGDVYGTIASLMGSDEETSKFLHRLGYKGIKFPGDNGETGEKFMNYVIFDPDDIKILEKTKL